MDKTVPAPRRPLVYAIDDDASLNRVVEARFAKLGCDCKTFTDPAALHAAIAQRRPQLLIVDLNLGDEVSGFKVIQAVRAGPAASCPIIVLSGEQENEKIAHALELGANDYVSKSALRESFENHVAAYISAEALALPIQPELQPLKSDLDVKIGFHLAIQEVQPLGFTLVSTHLIKKGTALWLSGDAIRAISPTAERVLVTAISSAVLAGSERRYQIRVEIDAGDERILQDVKAFLGRMRASGAAAD